MIGFKVLTKQGLRGPFKKSSIIKAITGAEIPLQARLLDLETGLYLSAAELVGEMVDPAKLEEKPAAGEGAKGAEEKENPDVETADPLELEDLTSISDYLLGEDADLKLE